MGIFDMGEGDSSFGEGMSELRGGNEAEQRREMLRMQQAGQQQEQSRRQTAQQRARAMQEHAANLKKQADRVRKMRNLRYLRFFGCCSCSTILWLLLISIIIVIVVAIVADAWGWVVEHIPGAKQLLDWLSSDTGAPKDQTAEQMQKAADYLGGLK